MVDKLLDTVARYKHLFNPISTLTHTGEGVKSAPTGKLRLSKDPKMNHALWNSIFVGGSLLPIAYLVNTLANKKHEADIEDKLNSSLVDKLNALRPRLVADEDLADDTSFTELPKRELEQLEELKDELNKSASSEDDDASISEQLGAAGEEVFSDILGDLGKNVLPVATIPAAVLLGVGLSNYVNKNRIKEKLKARRVQLRNIQSKIDRKQLQLAGLVKGANTQPMNKVAESREKATENVFKRGVIDIPLLSWLLGSLALGAGSLHLLRKKDENLAKLKYLKKMQLGSNVLQDTPKLSVLDLPASPEEILAIPGDKKQRVLIEAEAANDKKPIALLEDTDLFQEVGSGKDKEKVAIY